MKKTKRITALLMAMLLMCSAFATGITVKAAEYTNTTDKQIETNTENKESEYSEEEKKLNEETISEDDSSNSTENQDDAISDEAGEEQITEENATSGLINYLGVDKPYLTSPDTQKIVVSYGDGTEEITEAKIVYQKADGTVYEEQMTERQSELFLFEHTFNGEDKGIYTVVRFLCVENGVEKSVELEDIGIKAQFGVDEKYPGYDAGNGTVSADDIEISVVDAQSNEEGKKIEGNVEEAISNTAEEVATYSNETDENAISTYSAKSNVVVVLDPGHGGSDSGALGYGLQEKDLTLKIAKYCKEELEQYPGVTVYMTREDDRYLGDKPGDAASDLANRVNKAAEWGADLLVSIHINAGGGTGVEVYYPNSNYNTEIGSQGEDVAAKIQKELVALGLRDRGIKFKTVNYDQYPDGSLEDYYGIIRRSKYAGFPGIIVEHAFIDNATDAEKLKSESFLKQCGMADATGIANHFGLSKYRSVQVQSKNDFKGTANIVVAGCGISAKVAVWNENSTSAKKWYTLDNGSGTISFKKSDFGNASGNYYVEVYDSNKTQKLCDTSFRVSGDTSVNIKSASVDNKEITYTLTAEFADMPDEVEKVTFPVWTADQSDLKWIDAKQTKKGVWTAEVSVSDYKKTGKYNVDSYAVLADGTKQYLGNADFNVSDTNMSVSVENYQKDRGTFDVVINNIKTVSGVQKIQVPVWCEDGQKDLIWHTAEKQSDGSYKATISVADHNYLAGDYNIHVYFTANNGVLKTYVAQNLTVSRPSIGISGEADSNEEKTYTLNVTNVGLSGHMTGVTFAVWSDKNGQDDLVWYTGEKKSTDYYTAVADIAKNHKTAGEYHLHVYGITANGAKTFIGETTFEVTEPEMTVKVSNYQKNKGTFDVIISDIKAPAGISKIQVPVWAADGQKDLVWHTAEKQSDGSYKATVNIADHDYLIGDYNIHVYLYTNNGLLKTYVSPTFNVEMPDVDINAKDSDGTESTYNLKMTGAGTVKNVKRVRFAVWSEKNGQDDLVWYEGTKSTSSQWTAVANITKNHKTAGAYQLHVYAITVDGKSHFMGKTTFEVTEPSMKVTVENYQKDKGTFDVVVRDIKTLAGVSQVQVPVWVADGQKDLVWHTAKKQNDGSYKVTINIADHDYLIGNYNIHVYLRTKNGVLKTYVTDGLNVSMPNVDITAKDKDGTENTYDLKITSTGIVKNVQRVRFAVWSEMNGQDDLVWYEGTKGTSGQWAAAANIAKNHKTAGTYQLHVYAVTTDGKSHFMGKTTFKVTEPSMSVSVENYQKDKGTFDVVVRDVKTPAGVSQVQVPVWVADGQKDLVWHTAEKQNDGSYKATIDIADHDYLIGNYNIHVYLRTKNGVLKTYVTDGLNVTMPEVTMKATDKDGTEKNYELNVSNTNYLENVQRIRFAVWSEKNGQDDLVWYEGTKKSSSQWMATADIANNHKTAGTYQMHIYAVLSNGKSTFLGKTTFDVSEPELKVNVTNYQVNDGTFDVIIKDIKSLSGVKQIRVPVWCATNQSDIYWYAATKQSDGTYKATVSVANHKNATGEYKIHVYLTAGNNIQKIVEAPNQTVEELGYYSIMGSSSVTADQLVRYYKSSNNRYPATDLAKGGAATLEQFCQIYYEEAKAEGVRVEVAFAQAMKETGWLKFGGIVKIDQYNYAGIGALDGNATGNCASFPNVRTGVRAQIQHLKAYACTEGLNNACVDPRFHLVARGAAPYVEWLGIKENPAGVGWASAKNYGYDIVGMIKTLKSK